MSFNKSKLKIFKIKGPFFFKDEKEKYIILNMSFAESILKMYFLTVIICTWFR